MSTYADTPMMPRRANWFYRADAWMDERGRGAWIAAMIVGFVAFWPVGLALLGYMAFGKGMFRRRDRAGSCRTARFAPMRGTGNTAFDAYRAETLRRLEDEREAFEAFLHRLREAKDKAEFDQFMDDRSPKANDDSAAGA